MAGLALGSTIAALLARRRGPTTPCAWAVVVVSILALAVAAWLGPVRVRTEPIAVRHDGVELVGTLYLPRRGPVHGAVVLVHGSGPQTRDALALYARWFAAHGIAGLAYDKRGTGESSGDLYAAVYDDYAADAAAMVAAAQQRPEIPEDAVGLMGFSEAEWVAPTAARATHASFVIVIGASGLSPAGQVHEEIALRLRRRGHPPASIDDALALHRRVLDVQRGTLDPSLDADLGVAADESWFDDAEDLPRRIDIERVHPWWRRVMDFDPRSAWRGVGAPVLLIKGEQDDRSDAALAEARLRRMIATPRLDIERIEGAGHNILHWPLGPGRPPPVFAPGHLEHLVAWVRARLHEQRDGG